MNTKGRKLLRSAAGFLTAVFWVVAACKTTAMASGIGRIDTADLLDIHAEADDSSAVVGQVVDEGHVAILERGDGWVQIQAGDIVGWVPESNLIETEVSNEEAVEANEELLTEIAENAEGTEEGTEEETDETVEAAKVITEEPLNTETSVEIQEDISEEPESQAEETATAETATAEAVTVEIAAKAVEAEAQVAAETQAETQAAVTVQPEAQAAVTVQPEARAVVAVQPETQAAVTVQAEEAVAVQQFALEMQIQLQAAELAKQQQAQAEAAAAAKAQEEARQAAEAAALEAQRQAAEAEAARIAAEAAAIAQQQAEAAAFEFRKQSTLAATGVTEEELYLLANIIYCEAGCEPYIGKVAVGNVVMNRVKSDRQPNTISEVIYARGQFSPVSNGSLARALNRSSADVSCYQAALEALEGASPVGDKLFFRRVNGRSGQVIGHHVFY